MALLLYLLTAWICSICVNAGIDSYVPICYPPCPYRKYCREGECVCKSGIDHFEKCVAACPSPKVYKACPSNCPRTCDDDPNEPISCSKECNLSRYCVCPDGYVERSKTDSTCVKKEECPLYCKPPTVRINCIPGCIGTCEHPKGKPGCRKDLCMFAISCGCPAGYVQKSDTDSTCVKLEDCPICQLPKDSGPCDGFMPMFYFDSISGSCKDFIYGGCPGNANRFKTRKDCEATCSICKLDKDPGPCEAAITRYFYNKKTKDCEKFLYGGCLGNANRFNTLSQCKKACGGLCNNVKCGKYQKCNEKTGKCVDFCYKGKCGANEVCRRTDGQCVCKAGYRRVKGHCIVICRKPKVYSGCSTSCPITCENVDNPPTICTADCRSGVRCVCSRGYVEKSSTDSTCVKKSQCPQFKCRKPKVYSGCSTSCPITCENVDNPPTICTADCRPGVRCVCPRGYVEKSSTDSTCVRKSQCPQYQCKAPKVYTKCATSCPETCDTLAQTEPHPCIQSCKVGVNCVCPEGYVEISSTDSTCVKKSACPCQLPKDSGPCEALIPMFYFNAGVGRCQRFNYGGCQGNANRFGTRKKCEATCSICKLDKDPGPCKARLRRYYYNQNTGDCEIFRYGGCKGNANRFKTLSVCRKACADPCILKICKEGYTCKNGKCVDSCYPKICKLGSYCRNGMCVNRCGSGYCGLNGICLYNECVCLTPGHPGDCTIY